jgi:hypothetical protein
MDSRVIRQVNPLIDTRGRSGTGRYATAPHGQSADKSSHAPKQSGPCLTQRADHQVVPTRQWTEWGTHGTYSQWLRSMNEPSSGCERSSSSSAST